MFETHIDLQATLHVVTGGRRVEVCDVIFERVQSSMTKRDEKEEGYFSLNLRDVIYKRPLTLILILTLSLTLTLTLALTSTLAVIIQVRAN